MPAVQLLNQRPRLNVEPSDTTATTAAQCSGHVDLAVAANANASARVDTGAAATGQRCTWGIDVDPALHSDGYVTLTFTHGT